MGLCGPGWVRWSRVWLRGWPVAVGRCCTPAVSGWVARRAGEIGCDVLVWDSPGRRWVRIGNAKEVARIRLEILLIAGRGESVYAASRSVLGNYAICVEVVDATECVRHSVADMTAVPLARWNTRDIEPEK
jgi:hypothetical protein